MTLEQVLDVMRTMEQTAKSPCACTPATPACTGPSREQMDALDADDIAYDDTPGVSSFCGAAAALNAEYHPATVSQTVIHHPAAGRTRHPVPGSGKAGQSCPPTGPLW